MFSHVRFDQSCENLFLGKSTSSNVYKTNYQAHSRDWGYTLAFSDNRHLISHTKLVIFASKVWSIGDPLFWIVIVNCHSSGIPIKNHSKNQPQPRFRVLGFVIFVCFCLSRVFWQSWSKLLLQLSSLLYQNMNRNEHQIRL